MSKITYDDQTYDLNEIRHQLDTSLTEKMEDSYDSDQDFFDSYLIAHTEKYGSRFSVS